MLMPATFVIDLPDVAAGGESLSQRASASHAKGAGFPFRRT